ncbi:MAG: hypothetical protein IKN38_10145 [Clostridia bacterium]|nr:hypothetical protein [Clostridia bacterium]
MVKKLIKYDFMSFAKVMLPIEIVLLGIAALYRILSFFETDSVTYDIFNVSAIVIFSIATFASFLITFILSIVRFYKNLFTSEGYLSLTLPVTTQAHIVSKLIVSLIFDLIALVCAGVAFCIATAGDVLVEVTKAAFFLFGKAEYVIGGQIWLYVIEAVVLALVAAASMHLLTYMCISIGQTAKKHKILPAVGIYFGVYVAKQIVGTVFITTGVTTNMFRDIGRFITDNPRTATHLVFAVSILVELVLSAVYFIVTRLMMKKKLNLE